MFYIVKMPALIRRMRQDYIWKIPADENILYLTFDDGPNKTATPFVLDELKKYNAKATFFCIGRNVELHPYLYQRILSEGHICGNHSYNHVNGFKTETKEYLSDVEKASKVVQTRLYRPPYGRIKRKQAKEIMNMMGYKIVMWHVLSGDFDISLSGEECFAYVNKNAEPGSVVVFHDSDKAFLRLKYALPKVLEYFAGLNFRFNAIDNSVLQSIE